MGLFIGKTLAIFFLLSAFLPIVARVTSENILSILTILKLLGIVVIYGIWCVSLLTRKITFKKSIFIFSVIYLFVLILFAMNALRGMDSAVFEVFRLLGLPYIPLAIIVFYEAKDIKGIIKIMDIIGKTAVICSIVGIIQWILGAEFLQYSLGLNFEIGGFGFHYGSAKTADRVPIFRAFSTMMSHYEFSTVVTMGMVVYISFFYMKKITFQTFIIAMSVLTVGVLVTYNMTAWAVILFAAFLMIFIKHRYHKSKFTYNVFMAIGAIAVIMFVAAIFLFFRMNLDERVLVNIGAGADNRIGSWGWRVIFLVRSLTMVRMQPFGWGWVYHGEDRELPLHITSDNYFIYFAVLGGIPFMLLFIMLFIVPMLYAFKKFRLISNIKNRNAFFVYLALWAFLASSFLSGFSNASFIITGVSNYIVWPVVGLIYKIPYIYKLKGDMLHESHYS